MINLLFALIFSSLYLLAEADLNRYKNVFNQIKKERKGIENSKIDILLNPFLFGISIKESQSKQSIKKKHIVYKLDAIVGQSVKINKKWYKIGSKIDGYKILKIGKISVILKNGVKMVKLYLGKRDECVKIIQKNK